MEEEKYTLVKNSPYGKVYESKNYYKKVYKIPDIVEDNSYYINKYDNIAKSMIFLTKKMPDYIPKVVNIIYTTEDTTIIMEKIEGITLNDLLLKKEQYKLRDINRIVISLISAVIALHDLGYCHNDLNHYNIIIRTDFSAVLIDFDTISKYNITNTDIIIIKCYIAHLMFKIGQNLFFEDILELIKGLKKEDITLYSEDPELASSMYNIFMML